VLNTLNFEAPGYTFNFGGPSTVNGLTITGGIVAPLAGDEPTLNVNSHGVLAFSGGSTAGAASVNVTDTSALEFHDSSSAGAAKITANIQGNTDGFNGGFIKFYDNSTAGNATITAWFGSNIEFHEASNAGQALLTAQSSGYIFFQDTSSANHATILVNPGGELNFSPVFPNCVCTGGQSTAGFANITNNGITSFYQDSTAGNATITTNAGGVTSFYSRSTGGNAAFFTNAGGVVDISGLGISHDDSGDPPANVPGMTAGSIAGAGAYDLGSKQLTVGSNNLSTTVSGVIQDGGQDGGVGGSLVKVGSGTLTLTNVSPYTGGTMVTGGAVVVGDYANPSAALPGGGPVVVEASGTLGGYGSVTGNVNNSGVVAAGSSAPGSSGSPFGAFTIIGNYVGAGGFLNVNTYLVGDGSPSDTLAISGGSAVGETFVRVANINGPGAETTGDGILIVNAVNGATTSPGAFALGGEVRAGPFDYDLFRGGLNGGSPNDWFLRSDFVVPPGPEPPTPEPPNPFPPDPPPNPLPPGVYPIIGPELATYGVIQPIARQLGLATLGTLHDRVGDTFEPDCGVAASPASDELPTKKPGSVSSPFCWPSAWARGFGGQIDNQYRAFADPSAHGSLGGFQGGVDLLRGSLIAGQYDRTGVYFGFGASVVTVDGLVTNPAATAYILTQTGKLNLDAYSGGAYWTHVGPGGWYLDAVVQVTVYSDDASTAYAHLSGTNGTGFLASLEGGYPISLSLWPRFVLEPQAQILWQHVGFSQAYDGEGQVALGSTNGPTGRIGLLAESTVVTDGGQVWKPYVRANLWESWGAQATTVFGGSSDQVPLLEQATWLELAGGGMVKVNPNWSLHAQAGYQVAVAPADVRRNGFTGDIGLRYTW
jgi:outer membrane autotransporter protein